MTVENLVRLALSLLMALAALTAVRRAIRRDGRGEPAVVWRRTGMAALLMAVAVSALSLAVGGADLWLWRALPLLAGTAAGGVLAVRWAGARWPEPALAAVLLFAAAQALLTVSGVIRPSTANPLGVPGALLDQVKFTLILLSATGAGVFLLPLADPAVRRRGPVPARGRLVLAALVLTLALLGGEFLLTAKWGGFGYPFFGLLTLVAGGLGSLLLVGAGLMLTLAGALFLGAWAGGLGVTFLAAVLIAWFLNGLPWFP